MGYGGEGRDGDKGRREGMGIRWEGRGGDKGEEGRVG